MKNNDYILSKIDAYIEQNMSSLIADLKNILKYRSVMNKPNGLYPFGEPVGKCLQEALYISQYHGMNTKNIDNTVGFAEIGTGADMIAILTHLDVVSEGDIDNWSHDPFSATINNGRIYARGAIDNKGPAIASLYAMKAIKEFTPNLKKRIRLIFGTNEESGSRCIKYYLKTGEEIPTLGFTPDADFPVIQGEMGILNINFSKKLDFSNNTVHKDRVYIESLNGGSSYNMVAETAYCIINIESLSKESKSLFLDTLYNHFKPSKNIDDSYMIDLLSNNSVKVTCKGASAHGSTPELGKNAISYLVVKLIPFLKIYKNEECFNDLEKTLLFYSNSISTEYNGESFDLSFRDEFSGKLIFNVGVATTTDETFKISINIRYPVTNTIDDIINIFESKRELGYDYEVLGHKEPIYFDRNHPLIEKLLSVYNSYYNTNEEPIVIGGGTYARSIPNIVAFGPLRPGQINLMHQKDEFISTSQLLDLTKLYARALLALLE